MIEEAKKKLAELVERFRQNADSYKAVSYNETQARQEFINPFFEILGWDVQNKAGYAEQYKDCVHEDSIMVGLSLKAPDYSFRIGGQRKFFLEAKKPSVNIKDDVNPALQLRRYAWSAKLALSIVTDFEELAVYDCRVKPNPNDKVSDGRIAYYTYDQYLEKFAEIYGIFSKEAVLKGSFDRYIASPKIKKGTAEVDKEFLGEIEAWRVLLAKNLALRNPELTVDELNFAVQHTLDRIIFLRICEDRGIEQYGQLQALLNGVNIYERLLGLFYKADDKYNSGLFDFKADALSHALIIDDAVLKETIENLYYPKSPYVFSVISVDILGSVYERFLGKVIRLTTGHQAKVEDKPEVKKAGGVYYTPAYIVEYIVKNTVGQLVDGKTPAEVSKLRIIDPACGSGSFLIGVYQCLLNYHVKWYMENTPERFAKGKNPVIYHGQGGWRLTTSEKKRILLNNVYGVDIDRQAVEVTKLSLLLKVLEDENGETLGKASIGGLLRERILPNLEDNIKCGNSLIGPDFYNQFPLFSGKGDERPPLKKGGQGGFGNDDIKRINVFDWNDNEKGFGKIMKAGGFDAVVGNPPYGYMIPSIEQKYFSTNYHCQEYQNDLYLLFMERYENFLKRSGLLGIIVSNTWLQSVTYKKMRQYLSTHYQWLRILYLPEKVFNAIVDTHVLIFKKHSETEKPEVLHVDIRQDGNIFFSHDMSWNDIPTNGDSINITSKSEALQIFQKIRNNSTCLKNICAVYNGAKPFEKGKGNPPQTEKIMFEKPYVQVGKSPDSTWSPLLRGSLIQRYQNLWRQDYWIQYGPWLAAPRDPQIFNAPAKIMVRQTGDSIIAAFIESGFIARDNLHIILPRNPKYNLLYILGIINSKLIDFIYTIMNPEKGEALAQVKKTHVEQLPIREIDFKKSEKASHDRVVTLVEQMLLLNKRLADAKTPHDKELLERQLKATDNQIDRLVYELYDLTEEEIRIVEGE